MPYAGFCIHCNDTIEGETKEKFGNALIEHYKKNTSECISCWCNVFQCVKKDENGNVVGKSFGLEATMETVCKAWTGIPWYEKSRRELGKQ